MNLLELAIKPDKKLADLLTFEGLKIFDISVNLPLAIEISILWGSYKPPYFL